MKLTPTEKRTIYRACELIATWRQEYSCVALYAASDLKNSLEKKYCAFYDKEYGNGWLHYEKYSSEEEENSHRLLLLLLFAEASGDV